MAASSTGLQGAFSSRACRTAAPCIHSVRIHAAPRLQQQCHRGLHAQLPQQLQEQQQHSSLRRRAGIIAAAGRRRRSAAEPAPEEEEPDLDMDDVMYGNDDGDGEADELPVEDEGEAEEFEEYEYEDEEDEEEIDEGDEELEGWDAALANFDAAQDAAAAAEPTPPSKEEQERKAALAMVRFDEDGSDSVIEVSDIPALDEQRPKTFEEQTAFLAPADKDALTQNRQYYASFPMDGIDLLVHETPDGLMNLADCFILDQFDELYSRPKVIDNVPSESRMYQLLPWELTKTGDFLKHIDPEVSLVRMYFVGVKNSSPLHYEVDMSSVYSFDCYTQTMERHEVKTLGENLVEPVLRIREDGIFIEDAQHAPSMVLVAEGFAGHPEEQYTNPDKEFNIRDFVKMGLWPEPSVGVSGEAAVEVVDDDAVNVSEGALEERLEELELMEEFDDMPDVPAVDMV